MQIYADAALFLHSINFICLFYLLLLLLLASHRSHPSTLSVDYQRQHARTADLMRVAGPNQRISQPRDDPYHQPNSQGRFGHPKSNAGAYTTCLQEVWYSPMMV